MTWQILTLASIRVSMAILVYLVVRKLTENYDIDDRIYWMFGIGYIVGRIWSIIGQ